MYIVSQFNNLAIARQAEGIIKIYEELKFSNKKTLEFPKIFEIFQKYLNFELFR